MQLPSKVQFMIEKLLGSAGESSRELRRAVFETAKSGAAGTNQDGLMASEVRELVEKIDRRPWTVGDEDFARMRQAGYSEDQIFELTVAAAVGAGARRFEAGLRAIEAARSAGGSHAGEASRGISGDGFSQAEKAGARR